MLYQFVVADWFKKRMTLLQNMIGKERLLATAR